ncbi:conserved hypothetical protein [Burkholderiales bacterium 8X]|nr:conserved hypothetical protein [Burkholderiales bacterium 8X]
MDDRALSAAVVGSVGLHLAVAIGVMQGASGSRPAGADRSVIRAYWVQDSAAAKFTAAAAAAATATATSASEGAVREATPQLQKSAAVERGSTVETESGAARVELEPRHAQRVASSAERFPERVGKAAELSGTAKPAEAGATSATTSSYLSRSELDTAPSLLEDVSPIYPPEAGLQEGVVVLRLSIGANGKVDRVEVISAQPPGLFDASAIAAFGQARFEPGRRLGLPVPSRMTIEVSYAPVNRGAAVSGQSGGAGLSR